MSLNCFAFRLQITLIWDMDLTYNLICQFHVFSEKNVGNLYVENVGHFLDKNNLSLILASHIV